MPSPVYAFTKACVDRLAAAAFLVGTSPLMLLIAVSVRADSKGPAIFRQKRLGRHGRPFEILKFRTMHIGSDVLIDKSGDVRVQRDDSRTTRVGRLLRLTSLDELPQLVNVLRGDMSLIGPRPDLPVALEMYQGHERRKLDVRPGLTGLSQVSGRNALDAHQKWQLDAEYAENVGCLLDLSILVRTVSNVLAARDIYKG